jgi:3'(2'), 5'-bisphosphate nucleotidase
MTADHPALLEALTGAVREAGRLIEEVRAAGFERVGKADGSLVTEADVRAEALLEAAIRAVDPSPVIGEESTAAGRSACSERRFWLLDPLDGTSSFCDGGGDYTVNVALIEEGAPVLGLVLHPPTGKLWAGASGAGAWMEDGGERKPLRTRALPGAPVVVVSHSNLDAGTRGWLDRLGTGTTRGVGSSLKFCLIAEALADVYPRLGPTSEWDTAAADAVLRAAGGMTFGPDGAPFAYGKPRHGNGAFLAVGEPAAAARLPRLI